MSQSNKKRAVYQRRQAHRQAVIRLGKAYRKLIDHAPQKTNKTNVQEKEK